MKQLAVCLIASKHYGALYAGIWLRALMNANKLDCRVAVGSSQRRRLLNGGGKVSQTKDIDAAKAYWSEYKSHA